MAQAVRPAALAGLAARAGRHVALAETTPSLVVRDPDEEGLELVEGSVGQAVRHRQWQSQAAKLDTRKGPWGHGGVLRGSGHDQPAG